MRVVADGTRTATSGQPRRTDSPGRFDENRVDKDCWTGMPGGVEMARAALAAALVVGWIGGVGGRGRVKP
jgi:hypothetical protein